MPHCITLQLPYTTEHNCTITEQYIAIPNFADTQPYYSQPYYSQPYLTIQHNYNALLNQTIQYYTITSPHNTSQ